VYQSIDQRLRADANGILQTAYIGVINPLNPRVESPQEVAVALIRAANFIPKEHLGCTDDAPTTPLRVTHGAWLLAGSAWEDQVRWG
jgi:hypothetical protein